MSRYADLKTQIARLQAQADDARRAELATVIAEIRQKINEYGLSPQDLGFAVMPRRGRPPSKTPLPPKYQDPKSGKTWSGRGKPPAWIAGKKRERFLVAHL
jgi:DNA-binding protein H-NS